MFLSLFFTSIWGEFPNARGIVDRNEICRKTTEDNLPTQVEVAALIPHLFDESHGKGIVHKDLPGVHKVNKITKESTGLGGGCNT